MSREISRLNKIPEVRGKYSLKFGRSITMSPGSFPTKGILSKKWITIPAITRMRPMVIRIFPIFQSSFVLMSNKGKLFLIPNVIAEESLHKIVTSQLTEILPQISHFLAENIRTARRYLSSLKVYSTVETLKFSTLDKDTKPEDIAMLMAPVMAGFDIGVISESGCPGIADPGSMAVRFAHKNEVTVVPMVGPSSIFLALMASGLNGQNFAFRGYLPVDKQESSKVIREIEKGSRKTDQTQIFIETPYRNNAVLDNLLRNLHPETLLTIAVDITGQSEMIRTKHVRQWLDSKPLLPKTPAVFLFLAAQ